MFKTFLMNYKVKISDINKLLEAVDIDDDGCISVKEFIKSVKALMFK